MSRLDDLKVAMARLTAWRHAELQRLEDEREQINEEYDVKAVALGREIAKLEPVLGVAPNPAPAPKPKKPRARTPKGNVFDHINAYNREHGLPEVTE